jgi:hypothetical protein
MFRSAVERSPSLSRTLCDDAEQVQTKLGTGASTPAANTVLRGTGTGSSAFGAVQTGDVTAGAITGSAFASETTNVDILQQHAVQRSHDPVLHQYRR